MNDHPDELIHFLDACMKQVLATAKAGVANGEHPFGAGIFRSNGDVVSLAHNRVKSTCIASQHAEVCAIEAANRTLRQKSLDDFWLVSSAEPCPMCLSTAAMAGISRIAFGASQAVVTESGFGTLGLTGQELAVLFNRKIELRGGILYDQCDALLLNNRR